MNIPLGGIGAVMKTFNFTVEGMSCGKCTKKISDSMALNSAISLTEVSLEEKYVKISGDDLSGMSLKRTIEELGFTVTKMTKTES